VTTPVTSLRDIGTAILFLAVLCLGGVVLHNYTSGNQPASLHGTRVKGFRFPANRSLYVVAADNWADNWGDDLEDDPQQQHYSSDTRAERLARDEFVQLHKVRLASKREEADFVLMFTIDPNKTQLAELFTSECYKSFSADRSLIDPDCVVAQWRAEGDSPKHLVDQFHKELIP
jgi:hypothetical protein